MSNSNQNPVIKKIFWKISILEKKLVNLEAYILNFQSDILNKYAKIADELFELKKEAQHVTTKQSTNNTGGTQK